MKVKDEAVGGLAAGVVGTVIGFPLDTIKVSAVVMNESVMIYRYCIH